MNYGRGWGRRKGIDEDIKKTKEVVRSKFTVKMGESKVTKR